MRITPVHISFPAMLACFILLLTGCKADSGNSSGEAGEANIYLSVGTTRNSINEDEVLWEDRVDELRMIMFDSASGAVAYNARLYFPDGFDQRSRAVSIRPGTYDFYFIANESAVDSGFSSALEQIADRTAFTDDPRFANIAYDPSFSPDATSSRGCFLMSAVYENIAVEAGGTEANPAPLPLPTAEVELIRSLAKVEVVFRKRVAGGNVPDNTITSVLLENVASSISVPPLDDYYEGATTFAPEADISGFDYSADSIGSVIFYIPELLVPAGGATYTTLEINNSLYPIESDAALSGLARQRRTLPALSQNSVIRNYHYLINAYVNSEGGLQLTVYVEPWRKDNYTFLFQGDQQIVIPPVEPTDSSIIIPTECGRVEILSANEFLSQGLQGAYNDQVEYWDPEIQGPTIIRGDPPYHCEKKYGEGWRLINSCELMSFLAAFDMAYTVWNSNTWEARGSGLPYYSRPFRLAAQELLEHLTGMDLSATYLSPVNDNLDTMADDKLGIIDDFFTPGDIMLRIEDFPDGWPFAAPPNTAEDWYYIEATIQVKAYYYPDYISPSVRSNWDDILYGQFERYDFSSTVSRCVRSVE